VGIITNRAQRQLLKKENAKWPTTLREIPREQWPSQPPQVRRVLRSRNFLVQEFAAPLPAIARLSICRTTMVGDRWMDGISWDELQDLKRQCGYDYRDAVEIFPSEHDVVNVANMRHLWILDQPFPLTWRRGEAPTP